MPELVYFLVVCYHKGLQLTSLQLSTAHVSQSRDILPGFIMTWIVWTVLPELVSMVPGCLLSQWVPILPSVFNSLSGSWLVVITRVQQSPSSLNYGSLLFVHSVSRFGLAVRCEAGKRKDLGSNPLRLSFLFKRLSSVDIVL